MIGFIFLRPITRVYRGGKDRPTRQPDMTARLLNTAIPPFAKLLEGVEGIPPGDASAPEGDDCREQHDVAEDRSPVRASAPLPYGKIPLQFSLNLYSSYDIVL